MRQRRLPTVCLSDRSDTPAADKRDVLIVASKASFDSNSFDQARRRLDGLKGIVVPFTVGPYDVRPY